MTEQRTDDDAYDEVIDRVERISNLSEAAGLLHWDQQVMMPEGGTPARSRQLSTISSIRHDLVIDEDLGRLLDDLDEAGGEKARGEKAGGEKARGEKADDKKGADETGADETGADDVGGSAEDADSAGVDLDPEQRAVVREVRRIHERPANVPGELVEEIAATQSDAQQIWQDARARSDFEAFAPTLKRVRDLHVQRANHIDPEARPYRVLFEDAEPYLSLETVERILDRLRDELGSLLADVRASDVDLPAPFEGTGGGHGEGGQVEGGHVEGGQVEGTYDEDVQRNLCEDALDVLGYDWERGRLDTSPHPFSTGNQFDARVTTRFDPADPTDALLSTIHEFGHASYQLGLPDDAYGTPLGQSRSHGVHESQSRFWENHVGRSRAFWELFLPTVADRFPRLEDLTVDEAYRAVNRVYPDNCIRVEADELTYHFHIILRAEIERSFVAGDIGVGDVPRVWNDKMDEYLGVRPETDAEGCLQDIHWTSGFARFQNYTVGSVMAAQLAAAMEDDIGPIEAYVREGTVEPIREWLTDNVHRHGQRYTTDELVEVATGEPLTAEYFLEYANEKFGKLYGL